MERFQKARTALERAQDEAQIARLVRECVGSLPGEWMAALPMTAQAIVSNPDADIPGAAIDMLRAEMRSTAGHETVILLHELAQTYATAATRLAKISSRDTGST